MENCRRKFSTMSEPLAWGELTREQKRALERLWAGGSTRRLDRVSLIGLALMGYVEDDRLTSAGDVRLS
jgi:hypothetical protein